MPQSYGIKNAYLDFFSFFLLFSNEASREKCINGENHFFSELRSSGVSQTEDAEKIKEPLRMNMRTDDERRRLEADLQNELRKLMETEMVSAPPVVSGVLTGGFNR